MNIKAKEPNTTECQQHHSTDLQTKDLSLDELEHKLGASSEGLSQTEVQKRLAQYGYNELPEKETNPYQIFLPLYRFSASEAKLGGNIGGTFLPKSRHNPQDMM